MHSQLYTIYFLSCIQFFLFTFNFHFFRSFVQSEHTQKKRELNCSAYSWRKSIIYVAIIYKWEVEMGWWFFFLCYCCYYYFGGRKTRRMWNEHNRKNHTTARAEAASAAAA